MRKPRLKKGSGTGQEWREKVDPLFVSMMMEYRENVPLGRSPFTSDRQKGQEWARNTGDASLRELAQKAVPRLRETGFHFKYDIAAKVLDLELADPAQMQHLTDDQFMHSWLSWFKFGKTWKQLQQERQAGSYKAGQQILAVLRDHEKWKFGKLDPNDMRFKTDLPHFLLLAFGLDFGLDGPTLNELADCFDALCTCGGQAHDPDNLRKLKSRLLASLRALDAKTEILKIRMQQP